ncbi:serine/threonine protein kinase [Rhodococcus gannanensis]|uniref:Serine/threonine protein kinase n=1 Tax=Rhodococcus gannanensis TaxID=1960308 RepID=A0ABW4PBP9_9NOCA
MTIDSRTNLDGDTQDTTSADDHSAKSAVVDAPKKKKKKKKAGAAKKPEKLTAGARFTEYSNPRKHPVVVALAAVCAVALVVAGVLAVLLDRRSDELAAAQQAARDAQTAEDVAGSYAVGAAQFEFGNLDPWSAALKDGTAPELTSRFDVAVQTLTPLIQEVQWSQTAKLIAATTVDVRDDSEFVVQVFVSTHMTSTQNPEGINTVTPYTITLDRDDDWLITDVAGIAGTAQDGSIGTGSPDALPADPSSPGADAPAAPAPAPAP